MANPPEKSSTAPMPAPIAISICILTSNRDTLLAKLLQALLPQISVADEIVILDTGQSESTQRIVSSLGSEQIHYHSQSLRPFNFAAARNELLKLAQKDGIAFIDDDAIPLPGWLEQIRIGLQNHPAVGGATLAQGELPSWWDPAINWCVGLSPPGTIRGEPGYYPDTCNMAARRELWLAYPFNQIPREDRHLYVTGREDADWWMQRRLLGENVRVNWRQAVSHYIHPDRISLQYIKQRAFNDGVASWLRRPHYRGATDIPWDLAHIAGVVLDKTIRRPLDRRHRIADVIWLRRQFGRYKAVWESPPDMRPSRHEQLRQLAKAAAFQLKIRAGRAAFVTRRCLQARSPFPTDTPSQFFVSADCLLGDSVLLRRHIHRLACTFPSSKILVSSTYPVLFSNLGDNIEILSTSDASNFLESRATPPDAAIVPYFPNGNHSLWRNKLAAVGATFDCDVGFHGRRDYVLARLQVPKSMELHEHENLARLFSLWTLADPTAPPPLQASTAALNELNAVLQKSGITSNYIAVQLGSGIPTKNWPAASWKQFLQIILPKTKLPVVLFGGEDWRAAGETIASELQTDGHPAVPLFGQSIDFLLALVSQAKMVIGGCSGPKHIAIEMGVPTFTLYAASEPIRWGAAQDHDLHGYINALPQKLSGMELQNLPEDYRIRLLKPGKVAEAALNHWNNLHPQ